MNNKGIGIMFCLIAAILTGVRYLTAAIFMSGTSTWSAELFAASLTYVGSPLMIASIVALVVGICFLIWGMIQDGKKAEK